MVAAPRGAPAGDARAQDRRLRLHLRRAERGRHRDPGRCRALTYPHTTYLLDDGRRPEMEALAELAGARYLVRPDNSHAKAGNINAALGRTEGELVLMLDADHVPMPDALDAMVGYFDDERMAVVQSPHDFFNHDSVQHYAVGRHEQSLFYRVVCPGKDRHGAAYWCGSAALIHRQALLEIGGVATETIAEDFHTTIRMLRHGWKSRYHDEVLVQGLAPHDLDGYLLQRDRWARATSPSSPCPSPPCVRRSCVHFSGSPTSPASPPTGAADATAAAGNAGAVLWTGELPMKISVLALAALWLPDGDPEPRRRGSLARGYMKIGETAHYELLTMEIYTPGAALHPAARKDRLQGDAEAGRRRRRIERSASSTSSSSARRSSAAGTLLRLLDLAGVGPLPDLPGIAAVIVPLLGLVELRRRLHTVFAVGRRRSAGSSTASRAMPRPTLFRRRPHRPAGWSTPAPPASASSPTRRSRSASEPAMLLELADADRRGHTRSPPRSRCAAAARSRAASWSAPRSPKSTPRPACS